MRLFVRAVFVVTITSSILYGNEPKKGSIKSFSENAHARLFLSAETLLLSLENTYVDTEGETKKRSVDYEPNPYGGISLGAAVDYRGFGFSASKSIGSNDEKEKYSDSKARGVQFYYFSGSLGFDVFYQDYTGFYMQDPKAFAMVKGDSETVRQDLSVKFTGANAYYVFSDDFSITSAFKQTERQNVSGGSFIIMASYAGYIIDSDGPLFPAQYDGGEYRGFSGGNFHGAGICPGYGYTLTKNHFSGTLLFFWGGGVMRKHYEVESGSENSFGMFSKVNGKVSLGYNGDSVFAGLKLLIDTTSSRQVFGKDENLIADTSVSYLEFYGGFRF